MLIDFNLKHDLLWLEQIQLVMLVLISILLFYMKGTNKVVMINWYKLVKGRYKLVQNGKSRLTTIFLGNNNDVISRVFIRK